MKNNFNPKAETPTVPQNVLVPSVRDKDGTGYDIFSLLLKERFIVVQGQVEPAMAGVIISQLRYLEFLDSKEPITMIINSPGGSIVDGLAIYDTMRQASCPITTIGIGMQASMGSVILAGGDTRLMAPNAQLLVHQGSGRREGTPSDMEIGAAFHNSMVDKLKTIYQDHTGLTREFWGYVLNRDTWFNAEQAKKIGFIHGITEVSEGKQAPYAQDRSLVDEFTKSSDDLVARCGNNVNKLLAALNSDGADLSGQAARARPQIAVALSQLPEFWTATKKAEAKLAAKAPANGNQSQLAAAVKKALPGLK